MHAHSSNTPNDINIEKFEGEFSKEENGVTIVTNATINALTSPIALAIYTYLICRPPKWQLNAKHLASHFDLNIDTIYKYLNHLIAVGLLARIQERSTGKFDKIQYRLYLSPRLVLPDTVPPDTVKQDTYKTKNILNKEKDIKTLGHPKDDSLRFNDFWNVYPLKKAKAACLKKWRSKNLDKKADDIISMLNSQISNDRTWVAGFIPHPLTYINQERWTDELDMRVQASTPAKQSSEDFHRAMAKNLTPKRGYYDERGNFTECYL